MFSVLHCQNKRVIENSVKLAEFNGGCFTSLYHLKNAAAQQGLSPANRALEYYSKCFVPVWLSQLRLPGRAAFC